MSNRLHLEGEWPGTVTIRRGWARATARPWNDDGPQTALRLERGSSEFLRSAAEHMVARGNGGVFSPALYPDAVRVWDRAGFRSFADLDVMEGPVGRRSARPAHAVSQVRSPNWPDLVAVDNTAFEGFWRMNRLGLLEAMSATPRSTVLQVDDGGSPVGYALVGTQMATAFLQRVAVDPAFSGRGLGTSLVRASLGWAAKMGARAMVLNVRPDNPRARDLYLREGFDLTGARLSLLRFDGADPS